MIAFNRFHIVMAFVMVLFGASHPAAAYDRIGDPIIIAPKVDIKGAVILFSQDKGWGESEQEAASKLADRGYLTIGINTPDAQKRITASKDECVPLIGEIEQASHEAQRALGAAAYHFPMLAGFGAGGALALALAGQTDGQVIDRIVAINPDASPDWVRKICHWDNPRPFVFPVSTLFGPASNDAQQNAAAVMKQAHPEMIIAPTDAPPGDALSAMILNAKPQSLAQDRIEQLPLIEMPVAAASDSFAILYSGDGGWRDLDKDLAAILQKDGMPVVGIDVLRYFWNKVTPEKTAADLSAIINAYQEKWGAKKVLLIGYSFGADILPIVIDLLPAEDKAKIVQVSLLGFADHAAFEVTVSGWLNLDQNDALPTLAPLKKIDPKLVQCFYGEDDEEDACKNLAGSGVEIIKTTGSHHFDGDYAALARRILDGAKRR